MCIIYCTAHAYVCRVGVAHTTIYVCSLVGRSQPRISNISAGGRQGHGHTGAGQGHDHAGAGRGKHHKGKVEKQQDENKKE